MSKRPLTIVAGKIRELASAVALQFSAATTANSSANMPHGTAPTSPTDGDIWTTTGGIYVRVNGTTVGPLSAGGAPGGSSGQIQYNNAGALGGFTASGDATINTSTGAVAVTQTGGVAFGAFATGTDAANLTGTLAIARIANATVTLAKIANASASSKLLGSGASGSGSAYSELTLGTGLSMSGTTLNVSGGSGTVTNTGTLTSGQLIFGNGGVDITVGNLSGDVSTSGSGVTTIGALKVATGMIQASAVTLAKIQNAAASSKLLGSSSSGSGAAYSEISLGANLAMSGGTLNAVASGGSGVAGSPQIDTFLASGTWTKPTGAVIVKVYVIGGGGGGGNGSAGTNASNRGGGGGGAGAQFSMGEFQASSLPSSVAVTVPTQANAVSAGGDASFGSLVYAKGGANGGTGTTIGAGGGSAATATGNPFPGLGGAGGSTTGVGTSASTNASVQQGGGVGGGGGAGLSTADAVGNGGAGARPTWRNGGGTTGGGGAGGTAGGAGTAGSVTDMAFFPGDGGGGGASTAGATGGAGGDGGLGSGGGGGGAARTTGGAGGKGGPAAVWVVTYF